MHYSGVIIHLFWVDEFWRVDDFYVGRLKFEGQRLLCVLTEIWEVRFFPQNSAQSWIICAKPVRICATLEKCPKRDPLKKPVTQTPFSTYTHLHTHLTTYIIRKDSIRRPSGSAAGISFTSTVTLNPVWKINYRLILRNWAPSRGPRLCRPYVLYCGD